MKTTRFFAVSLLVLACTLLALPTTATAAPPTLEWVAQHGSSDADLSYGVSADGLGNVYISGETNGSLEGTNAGDTDAFVSKYDASGTLLWTEQLGTSSADQSNGVSADDLGNVYISGFTFGSLGGTNAGKEDVFLSKYDASGTLLWTEQLGTSRTEMSSGVSADGLGNVYISGFTDGSLEGTNAGDADAFVSKYDAYGTLLWTEQLGTSARDSSQGVSADGLGNVYISHSSSTREGRNITYETFVTKYDTSGTLLWHELLGTSDLVGSLVVSADGLGNVYISGTTEGNFGGINVGGKDVFLSKYNASGTLLWTEQLGTSSDDRSYGVSADGLGNVYISGYTNGSLGGTNAGNGDAFVSKYDASGTFLWTEQLGTSTADVSRGVSADGLGNVYISGYTLGSIEEITTGGYDAFVVKINELSCQAGDFDEDCDVDGADFLTWLQGLGTIYVANDLDDWEANYGTGVGPLAEASIPEPTTYALALAALCLAMSRHHSF